jgi:hypothetical protein
MDPREFHGYDDAPRHTGLIVLGYCLMAVLALPGLAGVAVLGFPSDPCEPGATCGPEPTTFAATGLVLLAAAALCAVWSVHWSLRDGRYRFQPPPNWPPAPDGWRPPRGWVPPPTLPKAPDGWQFWQ